MYTYANIEECIQTHNIDIQTYMEISYLRKSTAVPRMVCCFSLLP